MNNHGNLGLLTVILLITFVLIGAVSASVIMNKTTSVSNTDLNRLTNEIVDEITSYLQIKTIVGQYQTIQGNQRIQKIAVMIKPLISQTIDLTHMIIEVSTKEQFFVLYFNGNVSPLGSYTVFDHPLWGTLTQDTYSVIPILDDDSSMVTYHSINKNTDSAFLLVQLPDACTMQKGDVVQITLQPSPGAERTVVLEAPLPISHVVTLYE